MTIIDVPEKHHSIPAADGLKLHAVEFGRADAASLPVICLPGLARTAEDFRELATALAANGRRVVALDYRGRGRSDYDSDPARYTLPVELADLLVVLTALDIGRAIFIGTSRGGILTMLLAATDATRIAGVVLNDIGPVIEMAGLQRIRTYVGRLPQPKDIREGAAILRGLFAAQFPNYDLAQWEHAARLTWRNETGRLMLNYDPELSRTLADLQADTLIPALWEPFAALAGVPVLVLRGGLSDLLSRETAEEMGRRHPGLELLEIPDEGHPVGLASEPMIARIAAFLARCEA